MTAFAITIISLPNDPHFATFEEVSETLHHGLLNLGYDSIRTNKTNIPNRRHIILGCNKLPQCSPDLGKDAILYNLEQVQEHSPWFNPQVIEYFKSYRCGIIVTVTYSLFLAWESTFLTFYRLVTLQALQK